MVVVLHRARVTEIKHHNNNLLTILLTFYLSGLGGIFYMIQQIITKLNPSYIPFDIEMPLDLNGIPLKIIGVILSFENYGLWENTTSRIYLRRKWKIENYTFTEEVIEIFPEKTSQFIRYSDIPYFVTNATACFLEVIKVKKNIGEPIYELNLAVVYDD